MLFTAGEIYSYIGIVALLVMIPGPNTVLVMQSVAVSGRRAGFFNVAGIVTAVYLNALLSGLGLSLIIMQSTEIYHGLKMVGAGYIVYLGLASLIDAYKLKQQASTDAHENANKQKNSYDFYTKGILTGLLNPKSALFFLAFFPQFMHQDSNLLSQSLILTLLYSLISASWYGLLVIFTGKLRHILVCSELQKKLKAITGIILVGLGIKIALQR
ncbi:lysine transporter LysE [Sporomusaceae bacterium FL31]|nr:lysine transporter LysE [Sporomusaceae bacterium FL31]GCE35311.1 lysine transporter LysE [Sporomusaceae bacterium]